jgi:hypothetical protein
VCVSLRQDLLKAHVGVRVFETKFTQGPLDQPSKRIVHYLNVPCTSGSLHVLAIHLSTRAGKGSRAASDSPWVLGGISCKNLQLNYSFAQS